MGDADYARRPVLGVAAGDDFDAHLVGVLDRAADVRQHRPAADPERRVVVVAARLREVHHGRVGRDEVRAALFHEGERRIRKVRAVLDAPHAGAYCRAGAFIAVGMAHHRYTLRRRGLHDDPQLRLRVHLLAGVLIGLTGALRRARLDHVHAVVEVHAHQQAERVGCIDAGRQLRESRVGEDVVTQVGRDEQAGRQDFRARKDATPHQLAQAHVLEKVGARTPNRRDSRLEGDGGPDSTVRRASTNRPCRSMTMASAGGVTGPRVMRAIFPPDSTRVTSAIGFGERPSITLACVRTTGACVASRTARANTLLLPQVGVGLVEPVRARRVEDVHIEGVLQRMGLVRHVARQVQHLARAHDDLLGAVVPDQEPQRAFQDVGELLILMGMLGDDAALLEIDMRQHHLVAGDHAARQPLV